MVLDSDDFQSGVLGEIDDVLGVLGVDRVVPIVVRVAILEPCWPSIQWRDVRSALVTRLYRAVCAVFVGVLSTHPVDFLEFFPGNRIHHHFSDDVGCHELQLVCHCDVGHCEVEDEGEDAAGGLPRDSL